MSVSTALFTRRQSGSGPAPSAYEVSGPPALPRPKKHFLEERSTILQPVIAHASRIIRDERDYELAVRATQVLLEAEEPSARTFFCAKGVVSDYVARHPRDPRGFVALGKIYLYSCGGDETVAMAEEALHRAAELSNQQDPETFFLLSTCARTRLLNLAPSSPHYTDLFSSAERHLRLALLHSFNALPYRFALSEFYHATEHPDLALATLEEGLSSKAKVQPTGNDARRRARASTIDSSVEGPPTLDPSAQSHERNASPEPPAPIEDDPSDAPVLEELGKFGMRVIPDLMSEGRTHEARMVCENALGYLRRALKALARSEEAMDDDLRKEWEVELLEAEHVYEDLNEGTLFDFAEEPDFDPRRPDAFVQDLTSKPPEEPRTLLRRRSSDLEDRRSPSPHCMLAVDASPRQQPVHEADRIPRDSDFDSSRARLAAVSRSIAVVSPTTSDEHGPEPTGQIQADARAFATWAYDNDDHSIVVPRPLPPLPTTTTPAGSPSKPLMSAPRNTSLPPDRSSSSSSWPTTRGRRRASDRVAPADKPAVPEPELVDIYDRAVASTLTDDPSSSDHTATSVPTIGVFSPETPCRANASSTATTCSPIVAISSLPSRRRITTCQMINHGTSSGTETEPRSVSSAPEKGRNGDRPSRVGGSADGDVDGSEAQPMLRRSATLDGPVHRRKTSPSKLRRNSKAVPLVDTVKRMLDRQ